MRLHTLMENTVNKSGLLAEHGFSMFIETEHKKIMFDTGQSGLFLYNAGKLGIDVSEVDYLILSHGHYDHTGGLKDFLKINHKAVILAKEEIFIPKFSGKTRFIGIEKNNEMEERISYVKTNTILDDELIIVSDTEIYHSEDTNFRMLYRKEGKSFVPDDFKDELFLILKQKERLSILTACSHRGITNICETALALYQLPLHMIIGGFHMKDCSDEQYSFITRYLKKVNPEMIGVSHCTGMEKYASLKNDLETKVFYNFTGNEITLK